MKTLVRMIFLALVIPLGATSCCHAPARASSTTMAPDDVLRRLTKLQAELSAAGQTNTAIEVSELAGAFMLYEETYKVRMFVGTLQRIRSGNTNLIELLENSLDTSIETFTDCELGERQLKALKMARDYRAKFPRKTEDSELDAKVAKALALPAANER